MKPFRKNGLIVLSDQPSNFMVWCVPFRNVVFNVKDALPPVYTLGPVAQPIRDRRGHGPPKQKQTCHDFSLVLYINFKCPEINGRNSRTWVRWLPSRTKFLAAPQARVEVILICYKHPDDKILEKAPAALALIEQSVWCSLRHTGDESILPLHLRSHVSREDWCSPNFEHKQQLRDNTGDEMCCLKSVLDSSCTESTRLELCLHVTRLG